MYSVLIQVPRFAALAAAVVIVCLADPWWSVPAWFLALIGAGCPKVR